MLWAEPSEGEPAGYLTYRVCQRWTDGLPDSVLMVEELIALTPEARAGLWQYAFGVDLVSVVKAGNVPVDEPLRWMLTDGRRVRVTASKDFLWVRLLDVEAALSVRRYASDSTLVLEVADAAAPATGGRYRLTGGPLGEATCQRTEQIADLTLDVADLAAAYLGGVRFTTLAHAGRVGELVPGALARADHLFADAAVPYCCTGF